MVYDLAPHHTVLLILRTVFSGIGHNGGNGLAVRNLSCVYHVLQFLQASWNHIDHLILVQMLMGWYQVVGHEYVNGLIAERNSRGKAHKILQVLR